VNDVITRTLLMVFVLGALAHAQAGPSGEIDAGGTTLTYTTTDSDQDGLPEAISFDCGNGVMVGKQLNAGGGGNSAGPNPIKDKCVITCLSGGTLSVQVSQGTDGDDTVDCGNDTLTGVKNQDNSMHGGGGDDTLNGGDLGDEMNGDDGSDALKGNDGDDDLNGGDNPTGTGNEDTLLGGKGNDELDGGAGCDQMDGGEGDDIYTDDAENDRDVVKDKHDNDKDVVNLSDNDSQDEVDVKDGDNQDEVTVDNGDGTDEDGGDEINLE